MVLSTTPQTFSELEIAKSTLALQLKKLGLSGIPSKDRVWQKYYCKEQMDKKIPQMSMSDYLYQRNSMRLDLIALNYFGKRISYRELFWHIEDTAKRFQMRGVKKGDYVNLAMPTTPETIYMIYALDKIGAVAALIDPRVNIERMKYYLEMVQSPVVGVTGLYAKKMRKAIKGQPGTLMLNISPLQTFKKEEKRKEHFVYCMKMLPEKSKEIFFNLVQKETHIISSEQFWKNDMSGYTLKIPPYVPDRTGIVEYTSGTTGIPKGLELSAASINLVVEQLKDLIECSAGETILGIMPPFISYGMICGIHNALCSGLESILIPNFVPADFPKLIMQYKPNNIVCVPSFLQILMKSRYVDENTNLSFINNIIVGGDKTSADFEMAFNRWIKEHKGTATISKGGGMAEYSSCAFYTPYENTKYLGAYGIPLPKVDAKIVDENDNELGYYEVGEIHISSEQAMKGYVKNKEATSQFFYTDSEGKKWGKSGDLGYIDINGVFTILNRKKEMIVRPDGHNVFPSEISAVIRTHKAVKECLVTGVKDPILESGLWPTAFIELKPKYMNQRKYLKEIENLCKHKLPLRDRPRERQDYHLVTKIVRTNEGKIDVEATIDKSNVIL
ncbi:MAG: acyl--CoA ligase [Blautia sp.]|nr:acyl--CoA ligase [Blautia sp.]